MSYAKSALALGLCAAMVAAGLFVAAPARAVDTSNTLVVNVRGAAMPPFNVEFRDVEWTADGRYALFVGTDTINAVAWWYDPTKSGDAAWSPATLASGNPSIMNFVTVEWDATNSRMVIAGDATSGYWYHVTHGGNMVEDSDPQLNAIIQDMVYYGGQIWAVGSAGANGVVYYQDCATGTWYSPPSSTYAGGNWWGCAVYGSSLYVCGNDGATNGMYGKYAIPNGPYTMYDMGNMQLNYWDMVVDTAVPRMLLVAGARSVAPWAVFQATGSGLTDISGLVEAPLSHDLIGIDIDTDGFAVATGVDTSLNYALVYDIWRAGSTTYSMERSSNSGVYAAAGWFYSVGIRPTGVQMALLSGSSYKYSYTSVEAPIQVDTAVPHIDYVDLYPTGTGVGSSFINGQTDVDNGDGNTQYTMEIRVFDMLGIAHLTQLEVWMWHDAGGTVTDVPVAMGPGFDAAGGENIRMHFTITSGSAWNQQYPVVTGSEETTLSAGAWTPMDATSAVIVLNFSPHQQVRYAPGPFVQAAGDRYGAGSEGQSTLNALDAANTWDFKVRVADDAPTTNYASAYDEFGFFKYTYLSAANIPNGGAVYGSGAPGTNNVVMTQSNADVTFCANCAYTLSVAIAGNLAGVAVPANIINSNQISVRGGSVAAETAFTAGGGFVDLIGPQAPLNSGRETTTSSWDANAGTSEAVFWEVNIPGVPEDSYVSTITWSITN